MALITTAKTMKELLEGLTHDLEKAVGGNKAASQRVRVCSVAFEKVAKLFRKESVASEKKTKGSHSGGKKKAGKAPAKKAAAKAPVKKAAAKAHKKPAGKKR